MFRWTVIGLVGFLAVVLTFVWIGERYGLLKPVGSSSATSSSAPVSTATDSRFSTYTGTCTTVSDAQFIETLPDGVHRYSWRGRIWRLPAPSPIATLCEHDSILSWRNQPQKHVCL